MVSEFCLLLKKKKLREISKGVFDN